MAFAVLELAFRWECPQCGAVNWVESQSATLDAEIAEEVSSEIRPVFATADEIDQHTPYLVTQVAIGPPFVTCDACESTHAAKIEAHDDDHEE